MSRTYRRTNKDLIRKKFGLPSDVTSHFCYKFDDKGKLVQWVEWHPCYQNEDHFKRAVRRFKSDGHRQWRTAPRWWKKLYFIDPERHAAKLEIRRCLDQGSFDDHIDPHYRGANWLWWWMVT